ncbi:MAG: hypothetical protein JSS36_03420 [Proteobacteria bacterium]|nr:hypothetical protein [Pseudomonadota bacterium]
MAGIVRTGGWLAALALLHGCSSDKAATLYRDNRCGGAPVWSRPGIERGELVEFNRLSLKSDRLFWNGYPVTSWDVMDLFQKIDRMPISPVLVFTVDDAEPCGAVLKARGMLTRMQQCSHFHHCAEYSEADWRKERTPPPPR